MTLLPEVLLRRPAKCGCADVKLVICGELLWGVFVDVTGKVKVSVRFRVRVRVRVVDSVRLLLALGSGMTNYLLHRTTSNYIGQCLTMSANEG